MRKRYNVHCKKNRKKPEKIDQFNNRKFMKLKDFSKSKWILPLSQLIGFLVIFPHFSLTV